MIKIKKSFQKRKMKIFLSFLLFSSIAWFISKLSENTTGKTSFDVEYINVPDSLHFEGASKKSIDVRLKASGFTFLSFTLKNKIVKVDVSKVQRINNAYSVPTKVYQMQIEKQLPKSMELLQVDDGEAITLELLPIASKKVPIQSALQLHMMPNFILENGLKIEPDSVVLKGPVEELNKLKSIKTEEKILNDVSANFSERISLSTNVASKNVYFSAREVAVSGTVVRFSEKVIKVPIKVMNLPETFDITIFPDVVEVLCKGKIEELVTITPENFEVTADFEMLSEGGHKNLPLKLQSFPDRLHSAQLIQKEVSFILRNK